MLDDFLIRAILAAIGLAIMAAPVGCFVVWRRMAYFGDATAHSAILGVALALAFSVAPLAGALVIAVGMSIAVAVLRGRDLATDTLLGVFAHLALALGLVVASFGGGLRIDLSAFLFGDILAVSARDVGFIWAGVALVLTFFSLRWRGLVAATLSQEMAQAAGGNPRRDEFLLMLGLAVVVAVSIKVVGALLIIAMIIIPAAAARPLASTPEGMLLAAMIAGILAAMGGLWMSFAVDTPAGPSMVCVAGVLFAIGQGIGAWRRSR